MDAVHCTRQAIPCKVVLPGHAFAALPHDIEGNPRLSPTDKAVLLALLFWARSKAYCWPSDTTIGRRIGRSAATVQRCLRTLETLGLIVREKTATNRTGRLIRLAWRAAPLAVSEGAGQSLVTEGGRSPVRDKEERSVKPEALKKSPEPKASQRNGSKPGLPPATDPAAEGPTPVLIEHARIQNSLEGEENFAFLPLFTTHLRKRDRVPAVLPPLEAQTNVVASDKSREFGGEDLGIRRNSAERPTKTAVFHPIPLTDSAPGQAQTGVEQAHAWLASGDPILRAEAERRLRPKPEPKPEPTTAAELLARIREKPGRVADAAELLARTFDDRKSWSGFHAICRRAFEGELSPEILVDALARATRPGVRNGGAVFMTVVGRWNR